MTNSTVSMSAQKLLGEEDYLQRMMGEVADWRRQYLHTGQIKSYDKTLIRYYYAINPEARGTIVVLHGFCEFIGKYRELLYTFFKAGYSVFFHEQRGHGRSRSAIKNGFIYVRDFSEYEKDLKYLLDYKILPLLGETLPEEKKKTHPLFLFGHSMGGAVATLFLEDYPEYFDAAVLSSPMHRMNTGGLPAWKIKVIEIYARLFHQKKRPLFGQKGFDLEESFEDSCAASKARFDYAFSQRRNYPEYQTGGATFGWSIAAMKASKRILKNAYKVEIPVLLFQAGKDTLVENEAQEVFAAASGNTQICRVETAKHEIMNGDGQERRKFYQETFRFLMAHEEDPVM